MNEPTPLYVKVVADALAGTAAPRRAIKAFCLQCVGFQRNDVTHCTAHKFALWKYRPYQTGEEE